MSTEPVAIMYGLYLFQSIESTSLSCARIFCTGRGDLMSQICIQATAARWESHGEGPIDPEHVGAMRVRVRTPSVQSALAVANESGECGLQSAE